MTDPTPDTPETRRELRNEHSTEPRIARDVPVSEYRTERTELEITPNVVIPDPDKRRKLGVSLYITLLIVGIATMFFAFFPELAFGSDLPTRIILFTTSSVNLIAAGFGIIVSTPNVPKVGKL